MTIKRSLSRSIGAADSSDITLSAGLRLSPRHDIYGINCSPYSGSVTPGEWAVVFGESPLSLPDAVSTHLEYIKAFGKCAQADTPTPTVPVDIVCNNGAIKVKDDELPVGYKRLQDIHFDGDCYYETDKKLYGNDVITLTLQADISGGQNIFGAYSGTGANVSNLSLYIYANTTGGSYFRANQTLLRPVLGTGKRTISFGNGATSGFFKDVTYDVEEFETTDTAQIGALPNSSSPKFTGYLSGNITIGNRLKYIPCERASDSAIGYYETVNGEFLENQGTGTPTTSGYDASHLTEIYYDGTVETVQAHGKNLFDKAGNMTAGYINSSGSIISSPTNVVRVSDYIEIKPSTTYIISGAGDVAAASFDRYAYTYTADKTPIAQVPSIRGGLAQSFTTANNAKFVRVQCLNNNINTCQLELGGTATDYEPYYNGGTANCENLLSVGAHKDMQNITNGAITRNVGVKVFDGTEDWEAQTAVGTYRYRLEGKLLEKSLFYSTHFVYSSATSTGLTDGEMMCGAASQNIYVCKTDMVSLDDFKAWLAAQYVAGTPVIIVYPLATPTTETVTGQTMTIAKGDNIISATGSLTGLELEAKYKKAS